MLWQLEPKEPNLKCVKLERVVAPGLLLAMSFATGQVPTTWQSRGVGGGGALFCPSINPANEDECYVACDMSGLYHTTDFGLSWQTLDFRAIQGGVCSWMQFTSTPGPRYCVNNANDAAIPSRSTDAGLTWSALPGLPYPYDGVFYLSADYDHPNRVLIAYYTEVYFSANGGSQFSLIHTARNSGGGIAVGGAFFSGDSIFVGTNDGLLVSLNGGVSFNLESLPGIAGAERIFSFTGARQSGVTRLFCLTADSSDIWAGRQGYEYWDFLRGVYSLDYGAANWNSRMNGITIGQDYLMYTAMARNDISTAYLFGSSSSGEPNVMKTTDAGASWQHVFLTANNQNIITGWSGYHGDRGWSYGECVLGWCVAPENPNRVVFSDLGFVHKTSDGGTTWQQAYVSPADAHPAGAPTPTGRPYHGIGVENTSCWQILWSDEQNLFAGFSDIRGIRSTDAGLTWSFNYTGHSQNTTYRIVRHPGTGTLYAATSTVHDIYQSTRLTDAVLDASSALGKIVFSTDAGATWSDLHDFSHPVFWLSLDPRNPNRMYASVINHTLGLGGIYVCNDLQNGPSSHWTKLPDPPRTEGHPATVVVLNDSSVVATFSGRRNSSGAFTASSGTFIYNPGDRKLD